MPCRATSRATDLVKAAFPALQAEYTASPDEPTRPASDAMLKIWPPPHFTMRVEHDVGDVERSPQIDVDDLSPQFAVTLDERDRLVPARIVDEARDRSRRLLERRDGTLHRRMVDDVGGERERPAAALCDRCGRRLDAGAIDVKNADDGAFLDEPLGDDASDPARPTGQRHDFVGEPEHRLLQEFASEGCRNDAAACAPQARFAVAFRLPREHHSSHNGTA
jgi:hypothetical protein